MSFKRHLDSQEWREMDDRQADEMRLVCPASRSAQTPWAYYRAVLFYVLEDNENSLQDLC